ncbi:DNA-binding transcriptional LysR family regulator [Saccharothrix coeruleofusca]|uniref:LysR family transcriptional regulator n=1 Tax=Saccharothrix coeruleofusca TaxID=33919 RepID=UPI001AE32615|nr:LysR family transcriptional regulator [Saccharothrix coeruleofusca]MBP2334847.1 DNA-binding transcriptional LysR family regulator [Saccharothrix coeruleofusca]
MKPQLVHMQVFLAFARTGSVTAAARQLHLAPSRVSERVRELESELGVSLFDRSTRPATLTAAGQALLPRARAIVTEFDLVDTMFRTAHAPPIRVGVRSLPADFRESLLARTIRPAVGRSSLSLRPLDSRQQVESLRSRDIELGLVWHQLREDEDLEQLPLLEERFVIALPDTPRFHRLDRVRPADIVGLRLATNIDPWTFPDVLHPYLAMLPLVDQVNAAVEDGLLMLLSDGTHCSFVPASWHDHSHFSAPHGERVVLRPLHDPQPTIVTYLTWRRDRRDETPIDRVLDRAHRQFPQPIRR